MHFIQTIFHYYIVISSMWRSNVAVITVLDYQNIDWASFRMKCQREYLNLRGWNQQNAGENYIFWRFLIKIHHQMLLAWSNQGGQAGHVACMRKIRNSYNIFIDNMNQPSLRWTLKCSNVDWIHVNMDRIKWQALVNIVTNIQIP